PKRDCSDTFVPEKCVMERTQLSSRAPSTARRTRDPQPQARRIRTVVCRIEPRPPDYGARSGAARHSLCPDDSTAHVGRGEGQAVHAGGCRQKRDSAAWIAPPRVGIDNKPGDFEYVKLPAWQLPRLPARTQAEKIENANPCGLEIRYVARHNRQSVLPR